MDEWLAAIKARIDGEAGIDDFCEHAWEDIPWLLKQVARLRAAMAAAESASRQYAERLAKAEWERDQLDHWKSEVGAKQQALQAELVAQGSRLAAALAEQEAEPAYLASRRATLKAEREEWEKTAQVYAAAFEREKKRREIAAAELAAQGARLAEVEANRVRLRVALIILRNQVLDEVQPPYSDDGDDAWSVVLREVRGALGKQQVGEWTGALAAARAELAAALGERDRYRGLLVEWRAKPTFEWSDDWVRWVGNFTTRVDAALTPPPPAGEAM